MRQEVQKLQERFPASPRGRDPGKGSARTEKNAGAAQRQARKNEPHHGDRDHVGEDPERIEIAEVMERPGKGERGGAERRAVQRDHDRAELRFSPLLVASR